MHSVYFEFKKNCIVFFFCSQMFLSVQYLKGLSQQSGDDKSQYCWTTYIKTCSKQNCKGPNFSKSGKFPHFAEIIFRHYTVWFIYHIVIVCVCSRIEKVVNVDEFCESVTARLYAWHEHARGPTLTSKTKMARKQILFTFVYLAAGCIDQGPPISWR